MGTVCLCLFLFVCEFGLTTPFIIVLSFQSCATLSTICTYLVFVTENARQCFVLYWSVAFSMYVGLSVHI